MTRELIVPANAKQALPNRVTLDRADLKKWIETRTKLLYDAPMFSHIFYTLMSKDDQHAYFTDHPQIHTAATDDTHMFINPAGFFNRPIGDRVFIAAHEISHAMFGHAGMMQTLLNAGKVRYADGTELPFDNDTWQRSADFFINKMLADSKIGTVPSDAHISDQYPTTMSVLDIYRKEYQQKDKPPKQPGFDTLVSPGTGSGQTPAQAQMERDDDQWRTEIEAAMAGAKARGNLPGAFEEALGKRLEPQVPWQDQIVALFARRIGVGSYDWRRPDRRLITRNVDPVFAPGRRGTGCRLIVVVGDSSGSVTTKTAAHFFGEMAGILGDLSPETIRFAWCDTRVRGWDDIEDADDLARVESAGLKGRGGTDFRPPFRDIADMEVVPDCIVFLTDGDGPFPEDPGVPTIWGDISGEPGKYPFGDVVQIPVQA